MVEDLPRTVGAGEGCDLQLPAEDSPPLLATLEVPEGSRAPRLRMEETGASLRARPGELLRVGPWSLTFFSCAAPRDPAPMVERLADLAGTLRAATSPEPAAAAVLATLCDLFEARWGALLGPADDEGEAPVLVTHGHRPPGRDETVSRTVLRNLRGASGPILDASVPDTPELAEARSIPADVRSVIAAELAKDGDPVGSVYLERSGERRPFQDADHALLTRLARFAAEELAALRARLDEQDRADRLVALRALEAAEEHGTGELLGESPALVALRRQVEQVAETGVTALILGETGTGKELVARAIHAASPRARRPFVAINCAAIPEALFESELFGSEKGAYSGAAARRPGRFELAHRGVLFLDELGELPRTLQPKLLRALEEREVVRVGGSQPVPVDVQVVAATNRRLLERVQAGEFREDLYFRLAVYEVALPPLRERPGDILLLARRFLEEFARRYDRPLEGLEPAAAAHLERHPWPGNVRELRNVIERAVIREEGSRLSPAALALTSPPGGGTGSPPGGVGAPDFPDLAAARASAETAMIEAVLEETEGDARAAHRRLGVSLATLYSKCKSYGIDLGRFRPR